MERSCLPLLLLLPLLTWGCDSGTGPATTSPAVEWAIAIHGGAGGMSRDAPAEDREAVLGSLERALQLGQRILADNGTSLDAVEQVIRVLEDDPWFNAGRGAVFNAAGTHELDASIMDGSTLACGAVAGVRTVKNPISLARLVMEQTVHVLLAGDGADRFAGEMGVELVDNSYFSTERRRESLEKARSAADHRGTVGVVALDRRGDLAAGTSTGGLTNKMVGRVGDSPIVGAGTFADNRTCAVSGTGVGEEFIRHGVARSISALIEHRGLSLDAAVSRVVRETLREGDGGVIAVGADGSIAMAYTTSAMYRGAADSAGRFEVAIWD